MSHFIKEGEGCKDDAPFSSWDDEMVEGVKEVEVALLVSCHDHGNRHFWVDLRDGKEGSDCKSEDVVAPGRVIFCTLLEVLIPTEDEDQEFW